MRALAPAVAAPLALLRAGRRRRHAACARGAARAPPQPGRGRAARAAAGGAAGAADGDARAPPAAPAASRDDGSALLADVCASLGVRFELTDDDEAALWEDDYQEVVAEEEDAWGREAVAVDGAPLAPPPWLAAPDAAEAQPDAPGALRSAYSPAQGFREVSAAELAVMVASASPPLVVDVRSSGGDASSDVDARGGAAAADAATLRIPLPQLSDAVRAGRLDGGRSRGVVCVCDTGAAAAQAAVRLRRVFGFPDVAALRGGLA